MQQQVDESVCAEAVMEAPARMRMVSSVFMSVFDLVFGFL